MLVRKEVKSVKKGKPSRKVSGAQANNKANAGGFGANEEESEVQAKISSRSNKGIFKGSGCSFDRNVNPGGRQGLCYAKALEKIPDYSSFATR